MELLLSHIIDIACNMAHGASDLHLERQRGEIDGAIKRLRETQSRLARGAAA